MFICLYPHPIYIPIKFISPPNLAPTPPHPTPPPPAPERLKAQAKNTYSTRKIIIIDI